MAVNVFMGATGLIQVARKLRYDYSVKEQEVEDKVLGRK
jgi:hypothetical protein